MKVSTRDLNIIKVNYRALFFISIPITILLTALLYEPVSIAVYKIREPDFACPVKTGPEGIVIRRDAKGDGDFGAKRRNGRSHAGIDLAAVEGAPIYAAKSGLMFCGNVPTGYGKYVMIYHPDGFQTIYAHLSDWKEYRVKKIGRGEVIGFVGKTGNAAGKHVNSHLHFEIRKDGEPQDPQHFIKQPKKRQVFVRRIGRRI